MLLAVGVSVFTFTAFLFGSVFSFTAVRSSIPQRMKLTADASISATYGMSIHPAADR